VKNVTNVLNSALVLEDRLSLRDFIASHFTNLVNRERILAQTINQRFEEFGRQLTSHGLMVDAKAFNGGLKMDDWVWIITSAYPPPLHISTRHFY
jgi:hypothetical protein